MKSKVELEQDIIEITMKINTEFPELTKFIKEIPVNDTDGDTVNITTDSLQAYYNSLEELINEYTKSHKIKEDGQKHEKNVLPVYPKYPAADDIYNQDEVLPNLDLNDLSKNKSTNEENDMSNEKDFSDDLSGDDLDVPGSELDDQQESIGSEDEENNYYSLGGDNHNDLEEDNS